LHRIARRGTAPFQTDFQSPTRSVRPEPAISINFYAHGCNPAKMRRRGDRRFFAISFRVLTFSINCGGDLKRMFRLARLNLRHPPDASDR